MFKIHKFDLLVSVYIFCTIVSEVMGAKTFPLANIFGYQLNASVAIFVIPIIFSINDIIIEIYGKERARSVVRSSLVIIALLIITSVFFTALPPSKRFSPTESAYDTIFMISVRMSLASLSAFIIAEFSDIYIFSKMREKFGKSRLWLRTNISNILSQFIDTVVFMTLAFWALNQTPLSNLTFIASIGLPYWLLKCGMSVIETPFVYLGVKWLRNPRDES